MNFRKRDYLAFIPVAGLIAASMIWLDLPAATFFRALGRDMPELVAPFKAMTDLGKSQWYLYPAGIAALLAFAAMRLQPQRRAAWRRRMQIAGFIFADIAASGLIVDGLKILIGRPRPVLLAEGIFNQFAPLSFHARWWSFPSGHAATMLALALAIGCIVPRLRWPMLLFTGITAGSRIIVAAHYPADVIGGLAVAAVTHTLLLAWFVRRGWDGWRGEGFASHIEDFSPCRPAADPLHKPDDAAQT